jgi:hypothetical protein
VEWRGEERRRAIQEDLLFASCFFSGRGGETMYGHNNKNINNNITEE